MDKPADDTARIERLETALAHQERVVEELNAVVTAQGDEIATLTRRLEALITRFLVVEDAARPDTPVDKPPHW